MRLYKRHHCEFQKGTYQSLFHYTYVHILSWFFSSTSTKISRSRRWARDTLWVPIGNKCSISCSDSPYLPLPPPSSFPRKSKQRSSASASGNAEAVWSTVGTDAAVWRQSARRVWEHTLYVSIKARVRAAVRNRIQTRVSCRWHRWNGRPPRRRLLLVCCRAVHLHGALTRHVTLAQSFYLLIISMYAPA